MAAESMTGLYDREEIIEGCTIQILTNTVTGEQSIGWWRVSAEDMPKLKGGDNDECLTAKRCANTWHTAAQSGGKEGCAWIAAHAETICDICAVMLAENEQERGKNDIGGRNDED